MPPLTGYHWCFKHLLKIEFRNHFVCVRVLIYDSVCIGAYASTIMLRPEVGSGCLPVPLDLLRQGLSLYLKLALSVNQSG